MAVTEPATGIPAGGFARRSGGGQGLPPRAQPVGSPEATGGLNEGLQP